MANRSKRIGTEWETRLLFHARSKGVDVERLTLQGLEDESDLVFRFGDVVVAQAKAEKRLNLSYLKDAERQALMYQKHRNLPYAPAHVLILKRRNHEVGKAYVVQTYDQWLEREAGLE